MKKIIFMVFALLLVSGVFGFYYVDRTNYQKNNDNNESSDMFEAIKDSSITDDTTETEKIVEESKENANQEIKTEKSDTVKKDTVEQAKETENNDTKIETPKEEPIKEELTAWDELGISEYDYYNKPMWSWARVDYSIKDYNNESSTKEACVNAGNKLMEQGIGFSCMSVNSYSGTYLGEMLRTF